MTSASVTERSGEATRDLATVDVWDLGVRAFHWLLLALVATTLGTGLLGPKWQFDIHVISGSIIAALILLRVIWGFSGSTYARFTSFVASPVAVLRYAQALSRNRAAHFVGHNPLGAAMIVALLLALVALTATGVTLLGGVHKEGPLAAFTTYATGHTARELHEALAYALLGLIALHVSGVIAESLRTRESLVRSMFTGRKRLCPDAVVSAQKRMRPALAAGLGISVLALSAGGVFSLSMLPAPGVPAAPLDPVYKKECSACHTVHHPSIASVETWAGIMRGLSNHFGENASLDPDTTKAMATYLSANSSEYWDTHAANRLRKPSTDEPLRITATAGWNRLHRDVSDQAFKLKAVGGKLNCSQCHRDAEAGLFAPRAIAIPKETTTQ